MNIKEFQTIHDYERQHWWFVGRRKAVFDCIEAWRKGRTSLRILDIGCGTGLNIQYLARYGKVFGIDISPNAMKFYKTNNLSSVALASAMSLPFKNGSFDLLTCLGVMYHRDITDDIQALREFFRVCRQGGAVLITSPALPFLGGKHDVAMCSARRYYLNELEQKLQAAGFTVKKVSYLFMFALPAVYLIRRFQDLFRRSPAPQTDFRPLPSWLNRCLIKIMSLEAWLMKRFRLPFGVTALCLAEKRIPGR